MLRGLREARALSVVTFMTAALSLGNAVPAVAQGGLQLESLEKANVVEILEHKLAVSPSQTVLLNNCSSNTLYAVLYTDQTSQIQSHSLVVIGAMERASAKLIARCPNTQEVIMFGTGRDSGQLVFSAILKDYEDFKYDDRNLTVSQRLTTDVQQAVFGELMKREGEEAMSKRMTTAAATVAQDETEPSLGYRELETKIIAILEKQGARGDELSNQTRNAKDRNRLRSIVEQARREYARSVYPDLLYVAEHAEAMFRQKIDENPPRYSDEGQALQQEIADLNQRAWGVFTQWDLYAGDFGSPGRARHRKLAQMMPDFWEMGVDISSLPRSPAQEQQRIAQIAQIKADENIRRERISHYFADYSTTDATSLDAAIEHFDAWAAEVTLLNDMGSSAVPENRKTALLRAMSDGFRMVPFNAEGVQFLISEHYHDFEGATRSNYVIGRFNGAVDANEVFWPFLGLASDRYLQVGDAELAQLVKNTGPASVTSQQLLQLMKDCKRRTDTDCAPMTLEAAGGIEDPAEARERFEQQMAAKLSTVSGLIEELSRIKLRAGNLQTKWSSQVPSGRPSTEEDLRLQTEIANYARDEATPQLKRVMDGALLQLREVFEKGRSYQEWKSDVYEPVLKTVDDVDALWRIGFASLYVDRNPYGLLPGQESDKFVSRLTEISSYFQEEHYTLVAGNNVSLAQVGRGTIEQAPGVYEQASSGYKAPEYASTARDGLMTPGELLLYQSGESAGKFGNAVAGLAGHRADFEGSVKSARQNFSICLRNECSDLSFHRAVFSHALLTKDFYILNASGIVQGSLVAAGTQRMGALSTFLVPIEFDGGIPNRCEFLFETWAYKYAQEYGVDRLDKIETYLLANQKQRATFDKTLSEYAVYQACRDQWEVEKALQP